MSAPKCLQFVDTNILIDAHDSSAGGKDVKARALIRDLWQSAEGCLRVQVVQELYVNVTQKIARPLTPDQAAPRIANLSVWQMHRPGAEDVLDAMLLRQRYRLSFWDAMIVASAIQLSCERLWSEDLNAGQVYDTVTVRNPF